MQTYLTLDQIDQVTEAVRAKINVKPRVGIILGSGLNDLAASVKNGTTIPYARLATLAGFHCGGTCRSSRCRRTGRTACACDARSGALSMKVTAWGR